MCGIAGVYAFQKEGKVFFKQLNKAVESLALRGPDSKGSMAFEKACLGHTRLSIIDLSSGAAQPMCDVTKRYTIVYNGEIYNFAELRENLVKKGLPLKNHSDTEVILYSYIIEGPKCLEKFNGFFAFAIYDKQEDELFIARDRMGIKPLLYYYDGHKLLFASEMKAMLALGAPKQIDYSSLGQYFQLNYIPSPHTIFKQINKLEPGHFIQVKANKLQKESYYKIPYNRSKRVALSYQDAQRQLQQLMEESVRQRLIADVPLGAFLSGGVDSSVIVAEASKHTQQLNTFSIGYKEEAYFDETRYAELVAKKFNTNHQSFKLTNDDLYANLHRVLNYIDEPFADSSALAVNILSAQTRKYATVALSGDGADELFSGYNKHHAHYHAMHPGIKSQLIKMGKPLWKIAPKSRNSKWTNRTRQLLRYAEGLSLDAQERYWFWASVSKQKEVQDLLRPQLMLNELAMRKNSLLKEIKPVEAMNDILYTDLHLVLVSDMLHKVDAMSMENSLEVRTPFLDHHLVDFVMSLPDEYKINGGMRKCILQDAYRKILPAEIYQRPKHGFEVPLLKWFRTELKTTLEQEILHPDFIQEQGVFNPEAIRSLRLKLDSKNPGDVQANLWAVLVFQSWWKNYMC